MAIVIRNDHLERQVERIARERGHKTNVRTASELLTERLTQIAGVIATTDAHPAPTPIADTRTGGSVAAAK